MTQVHYWLMLGFAIGGAGQFWELHGTDPFGTRLWISMSFAALMPVGTYLVGLYSARPGS